MKYPLLITTLTAITITLLTSCSVRQAPLPTPLPEANKELTAVEIEPQEQVESVTMVATQSGQSALALLESHATIETQDYGAAGVFVTGIGEVVNTNLQYWAFYVNGEYSQTGASQTFLEPGDEIRFVYEKIDPNQL